MPHKGYKQTPEHIQKRLGGERNPSKRPDVKAKLSIAWQGDKNPAKRPEVRAKLAVAALRRTENPLMRPEIRAMMRGETNPMKHPDVVKKMIAVRWTPEARAKYGAAHRGYHPSQTTVAKLSETRKRRGLARGNKNPQWRGGISRKPYAWDFNEELKEEVRRRDRYQCQKCGVPQSECRTRLPVHHIDYDKTNSDPVNLIALCNSCNSKVNANREHWAAFFQAMMLRRALAELDKREANIQDPTA